MCPQPEQPKYKSLKSLSTGKKIIKIEHVEPRSYQPNTNELSPRTRTQAGWLWQKWDKNWSMVREVSQIVKQLHDKLMLYDF